MGGPRVPVALQQIFIASQRGDDVQKIAPPKKGLGFTIFKRSWGGFKARRKAPMKAPGRSSLSDDRSVSSMGSSSNYSSSMASGSIANTAADASRSAMSKAGSVATYDADSPQALLDNIQKDRGYSTKKYSSLEGGYYCRPTPLQQASYGSHINLAIRSGDGSLLRRMMDAGLSPNPCNNYGESLVHMVCRRGDHKLLRVLLEAGCSLQVTDDYGRTPLHDACWRADPSFECVKLILESDRHLLNLLDCRGASPLSYIKRKNFEIWKKFLEENQDEIFPPRDVNMEGIERPPPLTRNQPHSLPIPDPVHALPLEVAALVANGRMSPEDALYLDESSEGSGSSYDSDDSSYDSEEYSDEDEDSDFDQEEMAEFCLRAGGPMAIAQKCFTGGPGQRHAEKAL